MNHSVVCRIQRVLDIREILWWDLMMWNPCNAGIKDASLKLRNISCAYIDQTGSKHEVNSGESDLCCPLSHCEKLNKIVNFHHNHGLLCFYKCMWLDYLSLFSKIHTVSSSIPLLLDWRTQWCVIYCWKAIAEKQYNFIKKTGSTVIHQEICILCYRHTIDHTNHTW